MLQLLTFLVEKLSLICKFRLFDSGWPDGEKKRQWEQQSVPAGGAAPPAAQPPPLLLRRGDLLEVPRTIFTHYGIYLGEQRVAHLIPDILPALTSNQRLIGSVITNQRLILGCVYKCATVRVDTLEDFAYGSRILVNHMDGQMSGKAFDNEDVARRAEKLLGSIPYSLLWNNCEHFVTYCRYGSAVSRQTEKFCECLKSVIRDQRSVIVTVLLGILAILSFGTAPSTTVPTVLVPFALWMAG